MSSNSPMRGRGALASWSHRRRSQTTHRLARAARQALSYALLLLGGLCCVGQVGANDGANAPARLLPADASQPLPETQEVLTDSVHSAAEQALGGPDSVLANPEEWLAPERLGSSLQLMLLMTVLSLAPAVLVMTTSFIRIIVVLGLLRQALGTQQSPPSQVITSIALFLTLLIMTPVWKQVYDDAVVPYTAKELTLEQAWNTGIVPVRRFMSMQIERTGNSEDVWLFVDYLPDQPTPSNYDEVPLQALLPAFVLSELKTAFLIGFKIYLPFLILDMVIASVMVSMGMLMVPPVLVSLPFKLLLFVLVDGWHLVIGMLLESFAPFT